LFLLLFGIIACAEQKKITTAEPDGRLPILDRNGELASGLAIGILPNDWVSSTSNEIIKERLSIIVQDGVKALKLITGPEKTFVVRRTDAMLLATPYLNWSWNLSPHGPGIHPIRLIIGFRSGTKEIERSWKQYVFGNFETNPPKFDRSIFITWADSALQRGTLSISKLKNGKLVPQYIVRGGRENYGKWWPEFIDLSDLYNQTWPRDNMSLVQVSFIGIAASGSKVLTTGYLSEMTLAR
jgi:hypothetical protein